LQGFDFKGHNGYQKLTPEQIQAKRKEREERDRRDAVELAQRHADAARRAKSIWESATPCTQHPYLKAKGLEFNGLRVARWEQSYSRADRWDDDSIANALLIPIKKIIGDKAEIVSLQAIAPDGRKDFLPGGEISGCFLRIGKPSPRVLIGEGFATCVSAAEAAGCMAIVAARRTTFPRWPRSPGTGIRAARSSYWPTSTQAD
jgi:putative DNA primase/helicase